jgi:hypothetical protein
MKVLSCLLALGTVHWSEEENEEPVLERRAKLFDLEINTSHPN